ncbi:hypothetical protein RRF57_011287 [Xylaria bambusicola]|uniref:Uncharacterized protein n=1 Tax=Xylaria bambusicola TaxID=326684 RepID=A0AAN7UZA9_9PEZI
MATTGFGIQLTVGACIADHGSHIARKPSPALLRASCCVETSCITPAANGYHDFRSGLKPGTSFLNGHEYRP